MGLVLQVPEDVCNAAIAALGGTKRIGSLYDGSEISRPFLDVYGQTRDALLRRGDFDFAGGYATPNATGPGPFPWTWQFVLPADSLKIREAFDAVAYNTDENNPVPIDWRTGSAIIGGVETQVIWTKTASITVSYTRQVTDITQWEVLAVQALIEDLKNAFVLHVGEANAMKLIEGEAQAADRDAEMVQG